MTNVLVVSDSEAVRSEVRSALGGSDLEVTEATRGPMVRPMVARRRPDLVILDLQIGSMGGVAVCLDLRLEAGAGRLPEVKVLMLLDRRADVFMARRAGADGWLCKPLDGMRLGRAARAILAGGRFEDAAQRPYTRALGFPAEAAAGGS
ncbi:MAG: response regulator [Acidimicrobiales bacterium]